MDADARIALDLLVVYDEEDAVEDAGDTSGGDATRIGCVFHSSLESEDIMDGDQNVLLILRSNLVVVFLFCCD